MQRNSRLFARLALRTNRAVWQDLPRCSNLLRNLFFGFLHAQRHPGQVSQNIPFLFSLFSHYKGLTPVVPNGKCIDFKGTELCILQIIYIIHPTSPPKKKQSRPPLLQVGHAGDCHSKIFGRNAILTDQLLVFEKSRKVEAKNLGNQTTNECPTQSVLETAV